MTFDAYLLYCDWCASRGQPAPTREWFEAPIRAMALPTPPRKLTDIEFDISEELRDGYAYDHLR